MRKRRGQLCSRFGHRVAPTTSFGECLPNALFGPATARRERKLAPLSLALGLFIWHGSLAQDYSALSTGPANNLHVRNFGSVLRDAQWRKMPITVCWENPTPTDDRFRALVKEAVDQSWAKHSGVKFVDWQECIPTSKGIRILIADEGAHVKALGRYLSGMPNGMVLNFTFNNWSETCRLRLESCIEVLAVHEFGHALGFAHEQNRTDAPHQCRAERQGTDGDWDLTTYDPQSVMNYCNPNWLGNGLLSALDIQALKFFYGSPSVDGAPPLVMSAAEIAGRFRRHTAYLFIEGTLFDGSTESASGSGVVVDDRGWILTNSHVVPPIEWYQKLTVRAHIGKRSAKFIEYGIATRDAKADLVLLAPSSPIPNGVLTSAAPLELGSDASEPPQGTELYLFGFPLADLLHADEPTFVRGLLSNTSLGNGRWLTDAAINPGSSGGPVISSNGKVVALATSGARSATLDGEDVLLDSVSFLIPIKQAESMLAMIPNAVISTPAEPVKPSELRRDYPIDVTNDKHPNLATEFRRTYTLEFTAEPGFRITEAKLSKRSDTRMSADSIKISPDGSKVTLQFTLASGPAVDRYRGWLKGEVQTKQERR